MSEKVRTTRAASTLAQRWCQPRSDRLVTVTSRAIRAIFHDGPADAMPLRARTSRGRHIRASRGDVGYDGASTSRNA